MELGQFENLRGGGGPGGDTPMHNMLTLLPLGAHNLGVQIKVFCK